MKITTKHFFSFPQWMMGLVVILISSCYPGGAEYVDELDVVYTNYDPEFDFDSQNTFSLPDSVVEIDDENFLDPDGNDHPEFIDPVHGDVILAQIRQNMLDLGWLEVDKDANPDVVILPSVSTTVNLFYYYDWYYWNWWYPGWGPGWGWWYPGYYPPAVSGYRSGSVLIQMTYPKGIGANENIPVEWTAIVNGVLEGSTSSLNARLKQTIDQAFKQSPYLQ
jgi:hypothetical protein